MNYGFPQINNSTAIDLLTKESQIDYNRKFLIHTSENGRNHSLERLVEYNKIDQPLTESMLDKKFVYSEITSKNQQKVSVDNTLDVLHNFRKGVVGLASKYGYPNSEFNSVDAKVFNHDLAKWVWFFMKDCGMSPVDAASTGVWNYLQVLGCPSVVCWRWEKNNRLILNRIIGGQRGAFALAWWRYAVLTDFGSEEYADWINLLTEDAIQGILERPGMRGYTPIIIPFAKRISNIIESGMPNSVKYIRTASIQLRIKSSSVNFWYLLKAGRSADEIVDEIFLTTDKLLSTQN